MWTDRAIDVTVPLHASLPSWPGSVGFERVATVDETGVTDSTWTWDPHCGTHIDAPSHHFPDGLTAERLSLAHMNGPATVVDCGDAPAIGPELLERLIGDEVPARVLFRTRNRAFWPESQSFRTDYTALTFEGATWLAERGVLLVGNDYLSIQRFDEPPETHRVLLRRQVILLEGVDLRRVAPGQYELLCLPLPVVGGEGTPVRALLVPT